MATEQAHQTVYWHGDGAWDKESGSSVRRMRSKVRVQVTSLPECVVEEYQNGAWVQIEAPTAFNAEAGWSWQAHQRTLRGKNGWFSTGRGQWKIVF